MRRLIDNEIRELSADLDPPQIDRKDRIEDLARCGLRQVLAKSNAECSDDLHDRFKARIAVFGDRFIQPLARHAGFLGEF